MAGKALTKEQLVGLMVGRGSVDKRECLKLSATRFIPTDEWNALKRHEKEYLRCYAAGLSALKAVLVARSAARVNEMWVLPHLDEMVELATEHAHTPPKKQWPDGVVYRKMAVPDIDYSGASPRVTLPARTAVDIARFHGVREGVVAMDSLFYRQTPANRTAVRKKLESVIARLAGKRGIGAAREAFELMSMLSESAYESLCRVILAEHGIDVDVQMWIGRDYRVDLLWGTLVIEIDGYMKYEDKPHEVVMKQLARENWLREQGYEVIRLFPVEILRDEEGCVQRVLELKTRADARGPVSTPPTPYRP